MKYKFKERLNLIVSLFLFGIVLVFICLSFFNNRCPECNHVIKSGYNVHYCSYCGHEL